MFPIASLRRLLSCQPLSLVATPGHPGHPGLRGEEGGCVVVRGTLIERRAVLHVHILRKSDRKVVKIRHLRPNHAGR